MISKSDDGCEAAGIIDLVILWVAKSVVQNLLWIIMIDIHIFNQVIRSYPPLAMIKRP